MWNVNLVDWVDRNDNVMSTVSLVAATTGVLSHLLYFIRGEHHKNALFLFILSIWLPPLSSLVLVQFLESSFSHAAQLTASFTAAYLGALWTSMIIYRAFFHRLNHFPGPPLAKTSKLYHCFKLSKMDNFRKLTRWHEEYGDFVRIGTQSIVNGFLVFDLCILKSYQKKKLPATCRIRLPDQTLYPPHI